MRSWYGPSRLDWPHMLAAIYEGRKWKTFLLLICLHMGIEVQKSAIPTLINFSRVRAASQPHVSRLWRVETASCRGHRGMMSQQLINDRGTVSLVGHWEVPGLLCTLLLLRYFLFLVKGTIRKVAPKFSSSFESSKPFQQRALQIAVLQCYSA